MYRLTFSSASPYVRKVRLAAYLVKINDQIELVSAENKSFEDIKSNNPLGKIPVLMKPNGDCLFDSRVIIDYFNRLQGCLVPEKDKDRELVLTRCAMTEGIIDAALLFVYSNRYAGDSKDPKVYQKWKLFLYSIYRFISVHAIIQWNYPVKIKKKSAAACRASLIFKTIIFR